MASTDLSYRSREGMRFEHRYRCDNQDDPGGVQNGVYGVPKIYLEWCLANCENNEWGWHFEPETVYDLAYELDNAPPLTIFVGHITFKRREDLVIFKLRHLKG